jgi:hypothetical protein
MLPCTNTRSEDAALEGQGFKPLCLSALFSVVELSSSSIMASASRDFPTVPRTQPGTPARKPRILDHWTAQVQSFGIFAALALVPARQELSSPRDTGQSAPELKLSCLAKGLHTGNRCRCC